MAITLDGSTGVTAAEFDGTVDASNLTGVLPAIDGSALTSLTAGNLTGTLPAIDGSALTGISTTPTTGQVLSATAGASAGAVGTYILGKTNTTVYFGSNYSSVYASSAYGSYNQLVSGTWKCMGRGGANGPDYVTCFMRIA